MKAYKQAFLWSGVYATIGLAVVRFSGWEYWIFPAIILGIGSLGFFYMGTVMRRELKRIERDDA